MLIEFQRLSFPKDYDKELFKLQLEGITPIIAHPERYRGIQTNIDLAKKWINRGYKIQIDCASILGGFGKVTQNAAINLLKNNCCHLIGSDAHNNKTRNFLLKTTLEECSNIIGHESTNIILSNSKCVLEGKDCRTYTSQKTKRKLLTSFLRLFKVIH